MLDRITRHFSTAPPEGSPPLVEAPDCPHLMLRPRWETEGYVCEGCFQPFTAEEAEEVCSEALVRAPHESV